MGMAFVPEGKDTYTDIQDHGWCWTWLETWKADSPHGRCTYSAYVASAKDFNLVSQGEDEVKALHNLQRCIYANVMVCIQERIPVFSNLKQKPCEPPKPNV